MWGSHRSDKTSWVTSEPVQDSHHSCEFNVHVSFAIKSFAVWLKPLIAHSNDICKQQKTNKHKLNTQNKRKKTKHTRTHTECICPLHSCHSFSDINSENSDSHLSITIIMPLIWGQYKCLSESKKLNLLEYALTSLNL